MLIRFSATGYDQDFNSGGGFAGHKYAAMLVRVLVGGSQVGPAVRFFDNTGKVGVQKPRPTTTSYEWAVNTTSGVEDSTGPVQEPAHLRQRNHPAFDADGSERLASGALRRTDEPRRRGPERGRSPPLPRGARARRRRSAARGPRRPRSCRRRRGPIPAAHRRASRSPGGGGS